MTNDFNNPSAKLRTAPEANRAKWYIPIAIAAIAGVTVLAATYWPTPVTPLVATSPVANGAAEPAPTVTPPTSTAPTTPRLAPASSTTTPKP